MIALWMLYATLVTGLLAAAAWAVDGALALFGRPRRWAWAAAVAAGLALPAWGGWQATRPPDAGAGRPAPVLVRVGSEARVGGAARMYLIRVAPRATPSASRMASLRAWSATMSTSARRALASWDRALLAGWLLASAVGMTVVARGAWAVRRRRRGWRAAVVAGERVWLAPDLGPALVGALRPRVVLPTWVIEALDASELRLVLAHERAHATARDPLLLAFALGAVLVAPWNAALWLVARRLRLAAEADCDRRVLRAHPGARRYARLLVDVAERALGVPGTRGAMATALLDPPGLLERRVDWLLGAERADGRRRAPRVAGAIVGAVGVTVLACAVPRPRAAPAPARILASATPTFRFDVPPGCPAGSACPDSIGAALARARAKLERTERELRIAAVRLDSTTVSADVAAVRVDSSAMEFAARRMDSAAARMDVDARRMNAAMRASAAAMLDSAGRARQRQFVRMRVLYERMHQAPDTGTAPRPRVDSLFAGLQAAGAALTRDPRAKARFDSTLDALRAEVNRSGRPGFGADHGPIVPGVPADSNGVPDRAALRDLVARHVPQALTGALGARPYVWMVMDARGNVTRTAIGPEGMAVNTSGSKFSTFDPHRAERVTADSPAAGRSLVLDQEAVLRRFPSLTASQVGGYSWMRVPAGRDTVNLLVVTPPTPR